MGLKFENAIQSGGGGGTVTGANNGVSLNGANVVLGNDLGSTLGQLTSDRSIKLNNNDLYFFQGATETAEAYLKFEGISASDLMQMEFISGTNAGGQYTEFYYYLSQIFLNHIAGIATSNFTLNDTDVIATHNDGAGNYGTLQLNATHARLLHTDLIELNNGIGNTFLEINFATQQYSFGDIDATGNSTQIIVKDSSSSIDIKTQITTNISRASDGSKGLDINFSTTVIRLGDIDGIGSGLHLSIDGTANGYTILDGLGNKYFDLKPTLGLYQIGDIDAVLNNTTLVIDDAAESITMQKGGSVLLFADFSGASHQIQLGDANNCVYVDIFNEVIDLKLTDGSSWLQAVNGRVVMGDVQGVGNNTVLDVDDGGGTRQIIATALNGIKITGDTTLLHTGTALANGAGAAAGTLTNAPAAGDPTKWIAIDDNGTTRYIPCW